MILRQLIILMILSTLVGCEFKGSKEKVNMYEQICFEFYPSFISSSEFIFEIKDEEPLLNYKIFSPNSFPGKNDTIAFLDEGKVNLSLNDYAEFKSVVEQIDFINYNNEDKRLMLDGISVRISKINVYGDTAKIEFRSPDREGFKVEYSLMDAFFNLVESSTKERLQIEYVEALKGYFDY
ncbi:MAG: hypothetical protein MRZ79_26705 [Bacteroidia bacterium]|nr:hypothetical protein [Bacteroidia bacterium]